MRTNDYPGQSHSSETGDYPLARRSDLKPEWDILGHFALGKMSHSIAKARNIALMTGDARLRKAAQAENVSAIGTIGVLDGLVSN